MKELIKLATIINNLEASKTDYMKLSSYERGNLDRLKKRDFKENNDLEGYDAYFMETVAELELEKRIDFEKACYINNFEILVINEVLEVVVPIWNKYVGKKCGEKTKGKINDEIKAAFDGYNGYNAASCTVKNKLYASLYFEGSFITITSVLLNGFINRKDLEISSDKYTNTFIDENNVINEININDLKLIYHTDLIENVDKYIKDKEKAYAKVLKLNDELTEAIKEYRSNSIDLMENVYNKNRFHKTFY